MTTASPEAPAMKLKFCRGCRRRLPLDRFRFSDKSKGYRHSKCGVCRRDDDRQQKAKEWKSNVNQFSREVSQRKSPDALLGCVQRFCDLAGTTPGKMFDDLAAFALSSDCTPSPRIKIARSMLHIQATAELAQAQARPKLDEPDKVVRELHRRHQLLPTVRELYSEGKLSFDDIDPPPGPEV